MFHLTLRELGAKKLRLLTTAIAVMLGVAFMAGTMVLTATISKTFDGLFTDGYAGTDAYVRGASQINTDFGAQQPRVADSIVATIQHVDGVAAAEGQPRIHPVRGARRFVGDRRGDRGNRRSWRRSASGSPGRTPRRARCNRQLIPAAGSEALASDRIVAEHGVKRPSPEEIIMSNKAVVSLATGLEDAERVTVALLVAVGAAESGRPALMFFTKEAVRLAVPGVAVGIACDGCPPIADLMKRYTAAGGTYLVCPICVNARQLNAATLIEGATIGGTMPMWEWIGDEAATAFSY